MHSNLELRLSPASDLKRYPIEIPIPSEQRRLTLVQMKKLWMLNDLFVIKSARRKGVAGMLIAQCRKLACDTNAAGLLLETGKDNTEGNKLYPTEDFQLIDSSNFYFWKTVIAG